MARIRKWIITAVVAMAVAALFVYLSRPQPLQVEVAVLERGYFQVAVEEQGRTRARDPFIVAAPITGQLLRTDLDEGDRVKQGAVMASITQTQNDPRTEAVLTSVLQAAEARQKAVEAQAIAANSQLQRAKREAERRERLLETQNITEEEAEYYRQLAETAEAQLLSAQASVRAAQAEVESARAQLQGAADDQAIADVRSPADGTVLRVFEDSERVVAAGTPLFQLSNRDELEIIIDLLTQDAVRVDTGDHVVISGWGGDHDLSATVEHIEPEAFTKVSALGVEEQRVNVIASFDDTPAQLGAEYRVEAAIVVWEDDDVLAVPGSALFQRNNSWHVFVVENDTVVLRPVTTGQRGRSETQILDGLEAGEAVILFPSDLIEEGVEVTY